MYLWNQDGGRLIDGSSGLFNVAAGHGRREIADAVHAQMLANDYTPPFQLGHPGAFAFADRVARLLPDPFNHVFFANSGSEAIDTALKMVMAYHRARGESQRLRFVSRERAYHGVNIGGVSLAGMVRNRETFPVVMPNVVMLRHTWDEAQAFTRGQPERGADLADDLAALRRRLRRHHDRRRLRRAGRRLDRRPRAAQGLPRAPARDLRPPRHPPRLRRGHHRLRPPRRARSPPRPSASRPTSSPWRRR